MRSPGIGTVDAAMTRTFSIVGRRTLDTRVEMFNVFNQTNLGIPIRILESPGFGKSFDTQLDSRSIRIVAKVSF
jgi:hypothetical protein